MRCSFIWITTRRRSANLDTIARGDKKREQNGEGDKIETRRETACVELKRQPKVSDKAGKQIRPQQLLLALPRLHAPFHMQDVPLPHKQDLSTFIYCS